MILSRPFAASSGQKIGHYLPLAHGGEAAYLSAEISAARRRKKSGRLSLIVCRSEQPKPVLLDRIERKESTELMDRQKIRTEFAALLRGWREFRGFSQEELAERADLHRTYISDIEREARNPSLLSIDKLARALELSLPTFFSSPKSAGLKAGNGTREFVDVLLVEDNPDDAGLVLHAFKKARFANQINVVSDGAAALDYVFCRGDYADRQQERLLVILLDLNLPKISGLEVLRRIKADSRTRKIPVVILTASRQDRDIAECRRLGAETYIVKPLNFQNLSQATPQLHLNWALFKPTGSNGRNAQK